VGAKRLTIEYHGGYNVNVIAHSSFTIDLLTHRISGGGTTNGWGGSQSSFIYTDAAFGAGLLLCAGGLTNLKAYTPASRLLQIGNVNYTAHAAFAHVRAWG
jgi:hypothetical protein